MFSAIVDHYDFLNEFLSFQQAGKWRSHFISGADLPENGLVLDLCTGSGDIALGFLTQQLDFKGSVIAIDFSAPMIDRARLKVSQLGSPYPRRVEFLMGDALDMQFPDDKFDLVAIGFGIRNFSDTTSGLQEIHRVMKPGSQLNILEFFKDGISSPLVKWYVDSLVPRIGNLVSGTQAYTYLRASSNEFYTLDGFTELLAGLGFVEIQSERMTFGIAHIVRARKG